MPNAHVAVIDVDAGIRRAAASNQEGYYTIGLLRLGNYEISVEMPGFRPISHPNIKLDLHQVARMVFVLEVGKATESVEVAANLAP